MIIKSSISTNFGKLHLKPIKLKRLHHLQLRTKPPAPRAHPHHHTHSPEHLKAVQNRLARIAGHVKAVQNMIAEDRDCPEILIQLSAIKSAINGVCEIILQEHINHCVIEAVKADDTEAINELSKAIRQLLSK